MAVTPHSVGIIRQRQLSDFLNAELLHTLGAYRLAVEGFEELGEELGSDSVEEFLAEACERGAACNRALQVKLHHPDFARHPSPEVPPAFVPDVFLLESVADFYDVAIAALRFDRSNKADPAYRLGELLAIPRDPERQAVNLGGRRLAALRHGRALRMEDRLRRLEDIFAEPSTPTVKRARSASLSEGHFSAILDDHIQGDRRLYITILRAMCEAHAWMHRAEHLRAQDFGEMFTSIPETYVETQRMLRYSLALNTFVFAAARTIPWAFAEDETERERVIDACRQNCDRLTPTYCMWTATQFSLLALHRRAFTAWTMGKHDRAYRDFYKLTRLLRWHRAPAEQRAVRVPRTRTFIEGMSGMAELHIGRIYRGQHAHRMALKYFKRASGRLKDWEAHPEIGPIVINSQWRINLLLNQAKASYELGQVKESLLHYARAWRAFLLFADSESHATANVAVVKEFIEWIETVVGEPALSRRELRVRLEPMVDQFETLRSPKHLELLAAEIVLRMGHLLFVLKLPPARWNPASGDKPESDHDLAYKCVAAAARMDPKSTLIASDLLKIDADSPSEERERRGFPAPVPLAGQWPAGGGRFEEAARVIEYTLHSWLATLDRRREDKWRKQPSPEAVVAKELRKQPSPEAVVAKELLASFLAHTDSSNMKLAQVYRYLMHRARGKKRHTASDLCTLDLVCLRRYSSFFPFLPRPTAFRAPGGGYFVQVREAGEDEPPFGIAIDPGPDFIENLYRCGYALADLHMIVLTHDHADHIASLDALFALMGIRAGLGDDTFHPKGRRLAVVGNESVLRRYEFFNEERPGSKAERERDAVTVLPFTEIARITALGKEERGEDEIGKEILDMPESLRIEPVKTWGHRDAGGQIAQGFLLSMGEGQARSTVLFTGDTGVPPDPTADGEASDFAMGEKEMLDAVAEADVVVAHLSAVPLKELRELAGISRQGQPALISEFTDLWTRASEQATQQPPEDDEDLREGVRQAEFLLRQLQFGFRSRPKKNSRSPLGVSPFSSYKEIKDQPEKHLYLTGVLEIAKQMRENAGSGPPPLLLIGELREELGTFRTRIASYISNAMFRREADEAHLTALTADIGLRVRLARSTKRERRKAQAADSRAITVLCSTCDLDNDLVPAERFHRPHEVSEVCVKGEDEGVFYNCSLHDPVAQAGHFWLESVERYDSFGE